MPTSVVSRHFDTACTLCFSRTNAHTLHLIPQAFILYLAGGGGGGAHRRRHHANAFRQRCSPPPHCAFVFAMRMAASSCCTSFWHAVTSCTTEMSCLSANTGKHANVNASVAEMGVSSTVSTIGPELHAQSTQTHTPIIHWWDNYGR